MLGLKIKFNLLFKLVTQVYGFQGEYPSPFNPLAPKVGGGNGTSMIYRPLGKTGLRVSSISFGAWLTFSKSKNAKLGTVESAAEIMKACIENGINFFDNAESYGSYFGESETIMGLALQKLFNDGVVSRSDLVISTKLLKGGDGVNDKGLSRKHILEGMQKSLKRMQLDYVDLVFAHRYDPTTPLEEVVRAFNQLISMGKTLYWGTSEWSAEEIQRANAIAEKLGLEGPKMEQPLYNFLHRQRVEVEYSGVITSQYGLGLTVYSPLGEGILAGRYLNKETGKAEIPDDSRGAWKDQLMSRKSHFEVAEALKPIANKLKISLAQLSLAWCLRNDAVSTLIMGASKVSQVEDNVKSIQIYREMLKEEAEDNKKGKYTIALKEMDEIAEKYDLMPKKEKTRHVIRNDIALLKGPYFGGDRELEEF